MKTFKGTQGKWRIEQKYRMFETVIKCGKIRIAETKHYNTGEGDFINDPMLSEGFANAKLIVTSLEMLELLQYFVDENMLSVVGDKLAKKLIKKALNV